MWDRQSLEDSEEKYDLMNQSMKDKGVCRSAPATTGLLKIAVPIILKMAPLEPLNIHAYISIYIHV